MRVRCWGRSEAGRRPENQDAIAFSGLGVAADGELVEAEVNVESRVWLALLADGVGGSADGRWAARTSLAYLHALAMPDASISSVEAAVASTAAQLIVGGKGPGAPATTLAGIALDRDRATVFNIGDSRVYSLEPGPPRQLSVDHRSQTDRRAISRFLGGSPAHAIPAVSTARLVRGSWFLLVSDGVYAYVDDRKLTDIDRTDPHTACSGLVRAALASGSTDNLSVVIVAVG